MATHSSILAWIEEPSIENPGRLQSRGSQLSTITPTRTTLRAIFFDRLFSTY